MIVTAHLEKSLLLLGILTGITYGQPSSDDPRPREPILPRAPNAVTWSVNYVSKNSSPSQGPEFKVDKVKSITVEKAGTTYHQVTRWESGGQDESWSVGPYILTRGKGAKLIARGGASSFAESDFKDLTWIRMEDLRGFRQERGRGTFIFEVSGADRALTVEERATEKMITADMTSIAHNEGKTDRERKALLQSYMEAWKASAFPQGTYQVVLDAQTQLPLSAETPLTKATYTWRTGPSVLKMPADFEEAFRSWSSEIKLLEKLHGKGTAPAR